MNREPLLSIASITATVIAILALMVAFGIDLTDDQQTSILGVVAVAAPFVVAFATRPRVTPVADPVSESGERLVPASTRSVSRMLKVD